MRDITTYSTYFPWVLSENKEQSQEYNVKLEKILISWQLFEKHCNVDFVYNEYFLILGADSI